MTMFSTEAPDVAPSVKATDSQVEYVRITCRVKRDLEMEIADVEDRLNSLKAQLHKLSHETLPTLFNTIQIDNLGLPAEGNFPAYDAKLEPYYHANIAADWPGEKKSAAYGYLADAAPELLKTKFSIEFDRGDLQAAVSLRNELKARGVSFSEAPSVPWASLTAWVKCKIEAGGRPPLDVLGAVAGQIVKLKPRKVK